MESYASNEPRIGIVKTAMGACAQFAVFTMPMRGSLRMVVSNPRTSTANGTSFRGGHRGIYYSLRYEMPCNLHFFSAEPRKFLTSGAKSTFFFYYVPKIKPSAMSHAIHKTVSIKRCQSYFISRRSPHLGISKDSESCASAHRGVPLYFCMARSYANFLVISGPGADFPALHPAHTACPSRCRGRSWAYWHRGSRSRR